MRGVVGGLVMLREEGEPGFEGCLWGGVNEGGGSLVEWGSHGCGGG